MSQLTQAGEALIALLSAGADQRPANISASAATLADLRRRGLVARVMGGTILTKSGTENALMVAASVRSMVTPEPDQEPEAIEPKLCTKCGTLSMKVRKTNRPRRKQPGVAYRYRECPTCATRTVTVEFETVKVIVKPRIL
jgi:hypothetical protein